MTGNKYFYKALIIIGTMVVSLGMGKVVSASEATGTEIGASLTAGAEIGASLTTGAEIGASLTAGAENVADHEASDRTSDRIEIADAQGLLDMAQAPEADYCLTADIDMTGVQWKPFSFHGTLDGNGFAILNLRIGETGEAVRETFDGNMKVYDTYFAGLFDELSGGGIRNLTLINLRIDVETDLPCFIGGFAGYMEDAVIENSSVQGILELRAHDRMFGVGGMIGYGKGKIKDTAAEVTLVCIDTDATTRDEQFMGGVCAAGYPDINGCTVTIAGYDSDHGYVHDGGLVGMYMFYPKGTKYKGSITDNRVTGKITFFEDNKNRRAYCNGFIGEIMNWDFENGRNKDTFTRDEVFKYDRDLLPHDCENPSMQEEVTEPGCEFGYTTYTCETCGYTERDHYTLKQHAFEWVTILEATEEQEGLREGTCRDCGATAQEIIPKVIPQPTVTPETVETEGMSENQENPDDQNQGAAYLTQAGDAQGNETGKIWTVPEIGKAGTLCIAFVITVIVGCIVWSLGRKKSGR